MAMVAITLNTMLCMLAAAQAAPGSVGPTPPKIAKFLELCETSRRGAILQIEHTLRRLRRQRPMTADTRQRIAKLERQRRQLRSNSRPVVPQLSFPPQEGAIGRLPRLSCHVDQIVAKDEVLIRCYFPVLVTTVRNFTARNEKVVQPLQFLLRGVSTDGFHEGSDREMLGVFEVVGKEQYRTSGGQTKQVRVLRPFDLKSIEPFWRRAVAD